jgi:hypothetical protein
MLRLMAFCRCCKSTNVELLATKAPGGLPSQPQVCGTCSRHMGSSPRDLQKRETEHFEQWQRDRELAVERLRAQYAGEIERLNEQVNQLEKELADRPVRIVEQNLDQQTVDQASIESRRAYQARDGAYVLLAQLRGLHHDTGAGTCKCGRSVNRCPEMELLDSSSAYRRWEQIECERMRRGQWSQLPSEHPARTSSRWQQPTVA